MVDVEQMFYHIPVAPDDCHALRFSWWENGNMLKTLLTTKCWVRYGIADRGTAEPAEPREMTVFAAIAFGGILIT